MQILLMIWNIKIRDGHKWTEIGGSEYIEINGLIGLELEAELIAKGGDSR